jgi:hypothetical protein
MFTFLYYPFPTLISLAKIEEDGREGKLLAHVINNAFEDMNRFSPALDGMAASTAFRFTVS